MKYLNVAFLLLSFIFGGVFVSLYYKNSLLKKEISQLNSLCNLQNQISLINDQKILNDLQNNKNFKTQIQTINEEKIIISSDKEYFQKINSLYEKF